ncbi:alcohol dehydrogenase catalytic domain-containing protein [Microbacterium fluvii]|uniref:Alcohol dehydrogenase catalytic domain-containing protein n=1 Tax=Microbacterium fluvii TaxID=415215 RepID=A0ABW2HIS5_9MICO|nr:zinc-binding dehydrogenase [Microbacterium fluvii]MCU4673213.1 zinc-binding dehydrogenase [Microbacterium fluvii]
MTRAALYDHTGAPEVLYIGEADAGTPGAGQVLVRVHAAGLNPFDGKQRSGFIPSKAPFPRHIGGDFAGTVEAVGPDAVYWDGSAISVGDDVLGRANGALAESVVAAASDLARRPAELAVEVAGGLHVAGLTAVSVLATVPVGDGDTVLVGGAAGGVGLVAAQLAVAAGARVIGTASEGNHELLRSVGVEPVVYGEGLAERVGALGAVTAVFDCHGRDALDAGVALGVPVDRMVAIAAYGALDEIGAHNVEREARTAENLENLAGRIASGEIVLPVAETFPLDEVAAAFAALEGAHAPGKIVVLP